jgi:hypothetical protein
MKRPIGVSIVAGLAFACAIVEMAWAVLDWSTERSLRGYASWMTAIIRLQGSLYGLIGIGLWKLRSWARCAVIVLSALGVASIAFSILFGILTGFWGPSWILASVAVLYALCLGYMFTRKVKQAFSVATRS